MNRAEKRKCAKQHGKAYANKKYREEAVAEGLKQGVRTSIDMILYMTAYTINYKLGFGKKRLNWIMYHILDNIGAYNSGHLSLQDYDEIKKQMNKLGFSTTEHYERKRK